MGFAIGIDLGTTNTAVAVLRGNRPEVLADERGHKVLPSFVTAKTDDEFIVGQASKDLLLTHHERTVYATKRLIGRRYDSPEAEQARKMMPYRVEPGDDGRCLVGMGPLNYSPIDIAAMILDTVRRQAEKAMNDRVTSAVITVPAYFNHAQRAATMEAARRANLNCEQLVNEPTAAALAFGYKKDKDQTILVYDLGGGTFDVSVLKLEDGVYEVLSSVGDTYLGGEDFDNIVVDWLIDELPYVHRKPIRGQKLTMERLRRAAEKAKRELSFATSTKVRIARILPGVDLDVELDRGTLELKTMGLIDKTLEVSRNAVIEAGIKVSDIDELILVGGQTRMPLVRQLIQDEFKIEASRAVHPDEVVALGAAVQANTLADPDGDAPLLLDVTPFALGIDVAGGMFKAVVQKHASVPVTASQTFTTTRDHQESIKITVRQGDSRRSEDNEFLGEFEMSGLTPAPRMETKVAVTFRIDSNGMLHIAASEHKSGKRAEITVRNYRDAAQSARRKAAEAGDDETLNPWVPEGQKAKEWRASPSQMSLDDEVAAQIAAIPEETLKAAVAAFAPDPDEDADLMPLESTSEALVPEDYDPDAALPEEDEFATAGLFSFEGLADDIYGKDEDEDEAAKEAKETLVNDPMALIEALRKKKKKQVQFDDL